MYQPLQQFPCQGVSEALGNRTTSVDFQLREGHFPALCLAGMNMRTKQSAGLGNIVCEDALADLVMLLVGADHGLPVRETQPAENTDVVVDVAQVLNKDRVAAQFGKADVEVLFCILERLCASSPYFRCAGFQSSARAARSR